MDFLKKEFGQRLSKAIDAAGLTQEQFAELMKVEPPSVSRWINGVNQPRGHRKKKLFEILRIDESYFTSTSTEQSSKSDNEITLSKEKIDSLLEGAMVKALRSMEAINKPTVSIQDTKNMSEKDKLIFDITSRLALLEVNHLKLIRKRVFDKTSALKTKKTVNS